MAEMPVLEPGADPAGTPGAGPEHAAPLSVRLRRELRGDVIAVEQVSSRDLLDALAELWFESKLRRGSAQVDLGEVRAQMRPVYRAKAEASMANGGAANPTESGPQ